MAKESRAAYMRGWLSQNPDKRALANARRRALRLERGDHIREQERLYKARNRSKVLARKKAYRQANREKILAYNQAYTNAHREQDRAWKRKYAEANRDVYVAAKLRRRDTEKRIPLWADRAKIKAIYRECSRLSMKTGIQHHVDHVVPLQGKTVCGLHVENNLRIITAAENCRKSNSWGPI